MKNKKKVIDLTYLKEVAQGDEQFMKHMIELFIKQIPTNIKNAEEALAEKKPENFKQIIHKMKLPLATMGLSNAGKIVDTINQNILQPDFYEQVPLLLEEIKNICNDAIVELEEFMKQSG